MPVRRFFEGVRGGAAAGPDPYKARMQVMITRNMRKVCVSMSVCVVIIVHITAQSGPAILVIL